MRSDAEEIPFFSVPAEKKKRKRKKIILPDNHSGEGSDCRKAPGEGNVRRFSHAITSNFGECIPGNNDESGFISGFRRRRNEEIFFRTPLEISRINNSRGAKENREGNCRPGMVLRSIPNERRSIKKEGGGESPTGSSAGNARHVRVRSASGSKSRGKAPWKLRGKIFPVKNRRPSAPIRNASPDNKYGKANVGVVHVRLAGEYAEGCC